MEWRIYCKVSSILFLATSFENPPVLARTSVMRAAPCIPISFLPFSINSRNNTHHTPKQTMIPESRNHSNSIPIEY